MEEERRQKEEAERQIKAEEEQQRQKEADNAFCQRGEVDQIYLLLGRRRRQWF